MKTASLHMIALAGLASASGFAVTRDSVDIVTTVRVKFEAFDRHDAAVIGEIYAPEATLHSPDYPNLVGNSQIADTYRHLFEAIPDAKDEIQSLGSSGDKVYAQFVLTGHLKGAADKTVNVRIMSVYTVKAGHIVDDSTYYDRKTP